MHHRKARKTGIGFQGRFLVRGAFQDMQKRDNYPKPGRFIKSSWRIEHDK